MKLLRAIFAGGLVMGLAACGSTDRVVANGDVAASKPSTIATPMSQPKATTPPATVDPRPDFTAWPILLPGESLVGREFGSIRAASAQKSAPPIPLPLPVGTQSVGGRLLAGAALHAEVVSAITTDPDDVSSQRPLVLLLVDTLDATNYRAVVRAELFGDVLQPNEVPDLWVTIPGSSCSINGKPDDELLAIVVPKRSGSVVSVEIKRVYRFSAKALAISRVDPAGVTCPVLQGRGER
jgi:hypothetical protein